MTLGTMEPLHGRRACLVYISLTRLFLNNCRVGIEGAAELGRALETNTCLQELNLGSNSSIGNGGAEKPWPMA